MNRFQIIAGGVELDTYDDVVVSFNYQIDDIFDLSKRSTNYSKTVTIPGTSNNNLFFKQIFDVNIDNISYNPAASIPVIVRIGDDEIMKGNLQLLDIIKDHESVDYSITISGDLQNIFSQLDDFTLRNLDFSEFNHIRNIPTIIESHDYDIQVWGNTQSYGQPGYGYVYPYIVSGENSDTHNTALISDLYPAIYIKTIWDKLFEFTNYTYTSNFINSEYFSKLIMPYVGDKLQLPKEEVEGRKGIVGVTAGSTWVSNMPLIQTPPEDDDSGWWYNSLLGGDFSGGPLPLEREDGTVDDGGQELTFTDGFNQVVLGQFTCDNSGYYDVEVDMKAFLEAQRFSGGGPSNDIEYQGGGRLEYMYRLNVKKVDGSIVQLDGSYTDDPSDFIQEIIPSPGTNPSPWRDEDNPLIFQMSAENLYLEEGDLVRVLYGYKILNDGNVWNGTDTQVFTRLVFKQSYDSIFSKFSVVPTTNVSYGNEPVNMNQILPENMKMQDFFNNMVKMFNLVVQDNPNKDGDLLIEPRDDFFKSRERVKDWNDKLDLDSDIRIRPMSELDAKNYLYKYTKDEDWLNKEYENSFDSTYGEFELSVINDFSDKTNKTEVTFSPTPISNLYINDRVAGLFLEKNDKDGFKPKKVKPRILFYGGKIDCDDWYLKEFIQEDISESELLTYYPYAGHFDHPYTPNHDLNFGRTNTLYYPAVNIPNNNLYQEFHRSTLNNIIDVNSRLLTANFHLTPADIADFDFRDIIFLDGSYWRVNNIADFNPIGSDSLTKVVLYKIVDIFTKDVYSMEIPTSNSSCPADVRLNIRTGVYGSKMGEVITEDCCNELGGEFVEGICRVRDLGAEQDGALGPVSSGGSGSDSDPNGGGGSNNTGTIFQPAQPLKGGNNTVPTTSKSGPNTNSVDGNSVNSLGARVVGQNNYIAPTAKNAFVVGDNNTVPSGVKNSLIIGDGRVATKPGSLVVGEVEIQPDGVIIAPGGTFSLVEPQVWTATNSVVQVAASYSGFPIVAATSGTTDLGSDTIRWSSLWLEDEIKFSDGITFSSTTIGDAARIDGFGMELTQNRALFGFGQNHRISMYRVLPSGPAMAISVQAGNSSSLSISGDRASIQFGHLGGLFPTEYDLKIKGIGITDGDLLVWNDSHGDISSLSYDTGNLILQSYGSTISSSSFSTVMGGYNNELTNQLDSVIVGGRGNLIENDFPGIPDGFRGKNIIVGGNDCIISGTNSFSSGILGGDSNKIEISSNNGGVNYIFGGELNFIIGETTNFLQNTIVGGGGHIIGTSSRSTIVGSLNSEITESTHCVIISSEDSLIDDSDWTGIFAGEDHSMTTASHSAIIGGLNNTNNNDRTVVLGGSGITTQQDDTVVVPDFILRPVQAIPTSTSDSIGEVGSITWDATYLYIKSSVFPSHTWKRVALSTF